MIRARGLSALLFASLLLQVTGLGASANCLAAERPPAAEQLHPGAGSADVHAAHRAHAEAVGDGAMLPAADGGALSHENTQGDHAPTHCLMVMTCSAAGLVARVTIADAAFVVLAAVMLAHDDELPPSPGGAPEPPPPRG